MQQLDPALQGAAILVGLVILALMAAIVTTWLWAAVWFLLGHSFLPNEERRLVPWGAKSVLVAIVVYVALQLVSISAYSKVVYQGKPPLSEDRQHLRLSPMDQLAISATYNIMTLVVVPLILMVGSRARLREIGFTTRDGLMNVVRGVVAYPLLAPIVFGAFAVSLRIWSKNNHPIEEMIRADRSATTIALTVLTGVILAPLVEELMFRGLLLGWLLSIVRRGQVEADETEEPAPDSVAPVELLPGGDLGLDLTENPSRSLDHDPHNPYADTAKTLAPPVAGPTRSLTVPPGSDGWAGFVANVGVSLVFAGLHGSQWPAPIPIFVLSMGLGYLYQRTGSLVPSITFHFVFNGISTGLMFLIAGSGLAESLPGAKPAGKMEKVPAAAAPAEPGAGTPETVKEAPRPDPAPSPESGKSSPK